jgi:DNA end-binding protein Ku
MARTKRGSRAKVKDPGSTELPFHAFWSGSLSFGLVNVPVLVFPASRHSGVRLRLLSPAGSPLSRRFFCPREGKEVADDQIVRGYELDDGSYIIVEDRALEALEPEKSREIDLRQFVDLAELPPMLLERGYYLTPREGAAKAYRLLAEAMERTARAGIATFVMRDREYLVAIFARGGILCAETLRFHDEIRDPLSIGLKPPGPLSARLVASFKRAIDAHSVDTFSPAGLGDKADASLRAIIEKKRKTGRDLLRPDREDSGSDPDSGGDIDLLETIRRSLRHSQSESVARRQSADASRSVVSGAKRKKAATRARSQKRG